MAMMVTMMISPFIQLDDADSNPVWPNWAVDVVVVDDNDKPVWPT